jgi:Lon protease-like protein
MVADALAGDMLLATALIEPGNEDLASPPLCDVACIGQIIHSEQVQNGDYNILVRGQQRVRLLEEVPAERGYRRFRAQLIPKPTELTLRQAHRELAMLQSCVLSLQACVENHDQELAEVLRSTADPIELVDILSAVLISDTILQQRVLASGDFKQSLHTLNHCLVNAMIQYGDPEKKITLN